ncbi:MAG: hypothetical protein ACE5LU_20755 [Anaerolineae bacterium]
MSVPVLLVTWMGFMHPLRKLDFWWHLKVGEIILTSRAIPQVDLFSFTRAGQPFIHQSWLGELLYYLAYQAGGFPLLIAFSTGLLLLAFTPIYHLCLETDSPLRAAILCSLVAAFMLGLYGSTRPQTYSFIFFAAFYWILWQYREGQHDYLWVLPLLMLLWVNLHGAFVLGIGMIGIVLGAETARRLVRGPRADTLTPRALAKLTLVLGLTVLATMANPQTYRVFAYVRQLQVDAASQTFVKEWQVPDITTFSGVLLFYGPFFLLVLTSIYTRRRLNLTELGLFLTFAVLALAAIRSGIWFALIVTPILARHVTELTIPNLLNDRVRGQPRLDPQPHPVERQTESKHSTHNRLNWTILVCLVLFTVMLSPWVRPHLEVGPWNRQLVEQGTPVGVMDYIADYKLEGNVFHTQDYGDYLIWRLWPQQRSFIDGRVHLYDEATVRDYISVFHDDNWESRIAKYDIEYLLLPKDDQKTESMIKRARGSTNWTLRYEDEISILFEKQP